MIKKLLTQEVIGLLILLRAIILLVGESKWSRLDLLLEQINFVEENNERRVSEEHIVQHLSKYFLALLHSVRGFILKKCLIVVAQRDYEHN